jgi:hypothetical protein
MEYSKSLGLRYNYFPNLNQLIFEDGVCYTTEEAVIIAKLKTEDLRAVHLIKKTFGGKVLPPHKDEGPLNWPIEVSQETPETLEVEYKPDSEVLKLDLQGL